jgi:hypothetical protein
MLEIGRNACAPQGFRNKKAAHRRGLRSGFRQPLSRSRQGSVRSASEDQRDVVHGICMGQATNPVNKRDRFVATSLRPW